MPPAGIVRVEGPDIISAISTLTLHKPQHRTSIMVGSATGPFCPVVAKEISTLMLRANPVCYLPGIYRRDTWMAVQNTKQATETQGALPFALATVAAFSAQPPPALRGLPKPKRPTHRHKAKCHLSGRQVGPERWAIFPEPLETGPKEA